MWIRVSGIRKRSLSNYFKFTWQTQMGGRRMDTGSTM